MRAVATAAALALTSLFATGAVAQTSSNATSSAIPTEGVSQGCQSFLSTFNSDTTIQACTAPLLSATQFYANATAAAKNSTSTNTTSSSAAAALTSSLSQLCATDTGCDSSLIRQRLSNFWTACDAEIRAENEAVLNIYDILYLLTPFHQSVCTRDDSNNYCVLNIATDTANTANSTTSHRRSLNEVFTKRQSTSTASSSNITSAALGASNIAFLFMRATSVKSVLCSSCAKNIMASYISFETSIPYAIGLANSNILGNQAALYNSMESTCGAEFTTAINQIAGTTAFATVGGAGSLTIKVGATLAMAAFVAVAVAL